MNILGSTMNPTHPSRTPATKECGSPATVMISIRTEILQYTTVRVLYSGYDTA